MNDAGRFSVIGDASLIAVVRRENDLAAFDPLRTDAMYNAKAGAECRFPERHGVSWRRRCGRCECRLYGVAHKCAGQSFLAKGRAERGAGFRMPKSANEAHGAFAKAQRVLDWRAVENPMRIGVERSRGQGRHRRGPYRRCGWQDASG